ncbi:MAG: hypothetical protein AAFR79_18205, partial [Pseudomonadota bacterium]
LEKLLADTPHGIGENRLRSAHAALEQGDFSEAAEIFAEVKAGAKEHAAEAAYGEGLISRAASPLGQRRNRLYRGPPLHPSTRQSLPPGTRP